MNSQERAKRMRYAESMINSSDNVVCVCGQLFFEAGQYVDHVETCEHAKRGEMAAQGHVDFERD